MVVCGGKACWSCDLYSACCSLKDGCNNVGRGKYLSVFLELKEGFTKSSTYEYRIQLLWQGGRDASKDLVREHGRNMLKGGVCV